MTAILKPWEQTLGVRIVYSQEEEPLGTAGPIALAKNYILEGGRNEPFFVLNSDITSEFPLSDLYKFHKKHGKEGTIMVTQVLEPSKYGVVVYEESTGKISRFVEKPQVYVGNKINAGIYIFNKSILDRIPITNTSIETQIFPKMAEEGQLYCMELQGFWMDVGQPKDYLTGMCLYLSYLNKTDPQQLAHGPGIIEPVMIHSTAKVAPGSTIGPHVSIGPNVVIESGVRVKRTTVLSDTTIRGYAWIDSCIIGWQSFVGKWVRMEGVSVLGSDVKIADELYINGGIVLDHKHIKDSIPEPAIHM